MMISYLCNARMFKMFEFIFAFNETNVLTTKNKNVSTKNPVLLSIFYFSFTVQIVNCLILNDK